MSTRALIIASLLLVAACQSRAPEPTEPQQPRPVLGGCTQSAGEELYKNEVYPEAAWVFAEVLAGRCPAYSDGGGPRAEFWLAKSRYQLGDYLGALELFLAISRDPQHDYYDLTLPWLASLTRELDEPGPAIEAIGSYPPERLENEAFDMIRDELYYLYGLRLVRRSDPAGARFLAEVPLDSDFAIAAHFELGELRWREGNGAAAVEEYQLVLRAWAAHEQANAKRPKRDRQPEPPEVERARARLRSQGFVVEPPR